MTPKGRYDPEIHHPRTIRLKGHDYSSAGAYFVTVCTQDHERLFGAITDNVMHLSDAGRMVETWWEKIPEKFPSFRRDTHVVMPNHFHGIIFIDSVVGAPPCGCPISDSGRPHGERQEGRPHGAAPTLGDIMDWFKTMTTNAYIHGVKKSNWPPFPGRLWQRNYYERIIRDETELNNIREYVINNPARWEDDPENRRNTDNEDMNP